jgi:diguanylate cyclase (GGDEF)-like protein
MADRMRVVLRGYDLIGRYGGEEFLAVLPGCDIQRACQVAERMRQAVAAEPVDAGGVAVPVTVSLGAAAATEPGVEALALIKAADEALYRAKAKGRNRVETGVVTPPATPTSA